MPHLVAAVVAAGGTMVEGMTPRDLVDVYADLQMMTVPEGRWAKCGTCGGESDGSLDVCAFCAAVRKTERTA